MREFKFRVWHKKESRYLGRISFLEWIESEEDLDMKDVVVHQFTDLKDKNGKEIYEGDILKFDPDIRDLMGYNFIYSNLGHVWIYSLADGVTISYNHPYSEMSDSWSYIVARGIDENRPLSYEVVGNIFENPELLK